MEINNRIMGILTAAANSIGTSLDELIDQIKTGELEESNPKLFNRLKANLGDKFSEMFKTTKSDVEHEEERTYLDEEYYDAVKYYTGNFNFLLEDYSMEFVRSGHRDFSNPEFKTRFLKFITSINLAKKENSHNRFENEEQVIRRILDKYETKKGKNKKEPVEIRILRGRLKAIEKESENYR